MLIASINQTRKDSGLPPISFLDGVCPIYTLGRHLEERFEKGKDKRATSLLDFFPGDITGPFPHLSMNK